MVQLIGYKFRRPRRSLKVGHEMKINDKTSLGDGRTFVIAEIGSNHGQDFQLALDTIDAAAECGADAVKFQSIDLERIRSR